MKNSDRVPLKFRAPIQGRCQLQYAGESADVHKYVGQWLKACPSSGHVKNFGSQVKTRAYEFSWRFVTNSGQDGSIIQPVTGARGIPYYPGSSMKGAFRRACSPEQALKYCGGKVEASQDGSQAAYDKPAELIFHGGYPKDMSWRRNSNLLIDVVHEQLSKQVKNNETNGANVQISLYRPKYRFGISGPKDLTQEQWREVWQIWERALSWGIGTRVSAGYGQVKSLENTEHELFSVHLYAEGICSQLLDRRKTAEFRPNMFKAALRGHTMRLLAGITNAGNVEQLTAFLWGSTNNIGQLGIAFDYTPQDLNKKRVRGLPLSTYTLEAGTLSLLLFDRRSSQNKPQLTSLAKKLVQFSLLLGGFGKSWRRVDHKDSYPQYAETSGKPPIGCHWEFIEPSLDFYTLISKDDLSIITRFLENLRAELTGWVRSQGYPTGDRVTNWREVWHPDTVKVWGRVAEDIEDSDAIEWFHEPYKGNRKIKDTSLTGGMSRTGRIWHRMYPYYTEEDSKIIDTGKYVELLTIFPDRSNTSAQFLDYLKIDSDFKLLFGT